MGTPETELELVPWFWKGKGGRGALRGVGSEGSQAEGSTDETLGG